MSEASGRHITWGEPAASHSRSPTRRRTLTRSPSRNASRDASSHSTPYHPVSQHPHYAHLASAVPRLDVISATPQTEPSPLATTLVEDAPTDDLRGRELGNVAQYHPEFTYGASSSSSSHHQQHQHLDTAIPAAPFATREEVQAELEQWETHAQSMSQSQSRSRSRANTVAHKRRSSLASRRSATTVFMGVWVAAVLGIGGFGAYGGRGSGALLVSTTRGRKPNESPTGEVLVDIPITPSASLAPTRVLEVAFLDSQEEVGAPPPDDDIPPTVPPEGISTQRLIGRISAWACTTLYLTSRLPQIWKNFVRKSCEGLSMALFTFAFLGNLFYVLSIFATPFDTNEERRAFLKESVPYLLGSAGTLCFDVTIVIQSFVYAPSRTRIARMGKRGTSEEEQGLLAHADGDGRMVGV